MVWSGTTALYRVTTPPWFLIGAVIIIILTDRAIDIGHPVVDNDIIKRGIEGQPEKEREINLR